MKTEFRIQERGHIRATDKTRMERGRKNFLAYWVLSALVVFFFSFTAHAQNYAIAWFKISAGGNTSTGGVYSVTGTIGQPDTGKSSGGSYELDGGRHSNAWRAAPQGQARG